VSETSKTVANALSVLGCFSREEPVLTASELTRRLKLTRTAVIRLLATLERFGYLEKSPDGAGHRIGLRAFEIGTLFLAANPLSSVLQRALDELVEKTQCTAYLAILDGHDVIMINHREGTLPIRFVWQVGDRLPLHTTAMGKAMLACMSSEDIDRQLGPGKTLRGLTEKSIRTRSQLDAEIVKTRERGWGLAREESHAGLTAVGCAIIDKAGRPIAAISVSFLDYPPNPKRVNQLAAVVVAVAERVSNKVAEYGHYGASLTRQQREAAARRT
jgi:IclR family transcriptional regulator, KDG regulon repressor